MRLALLLLPVMLAVSPALAETPSRPWIEKSAATGKSLPPKPAGANACAAYGPGFARIEGSGTCVKIGGSIDVGAAASSRR